MERAVDRRKEKPAGLNQVLERNQKSFGFSILGSAGRKGRSPQRDCKRCGLDTS